MTGKTPTDSSNFGVCYQMDWSCLSSLAHASRQHSFQWPTLDSGATVEVVE